MSKAATTSPFVHQDTEEPWITWTEQSSVLALNERKQTERRSVLEDSQDAEDDSEVPVPPMPEPVTIRRPKYNAILNRMNQARKNTGTFTSWNT